MILIDEADTDRAGPDKAERDGNDARLAQSSSDDDRQEVEAWLEAVALCLGLPEGRRWIDP